ncbi:hypothetical protein BDB01DRAFT_807343 [Pilobolus umbonatus]|nr:hypothetical protein BDB01DRAFT_807343 [Pilobolus umbonatus]
MCSLRPFYCCTPFSLLFNPMMQLAFHTYIFIFLTLLLICLFRNSSSSTNTTIFSPTMYKVLLRQGITGGFAGPVSTQVVDIEGDQSGATIMNATLKPKSRNDYHTMSGASSFDEVVPLLMNLKEILSTLPTEEPVGSEDIYGQNISISFFTDDFQWSNGGPEGCSADGKSSVQATEADKAKFKQLVEMIRNAGTQYATAAQQ